MRIKSLLIDSIILFFLTIGFFWRVIFHNKFIFYGSDLIPGYSKLYSLSILNNFPASVIKSFDLSLFYPINFITSFIIHLTKDMNLGFRLIEFGFILHFFLLSIFTYLLIKRVYRLNRYASLFGAISFSFAGVFVTDILNFSFFYSITWLPLILLLYMSGLYKNRVAYVVLAGVVMGFTVLTNSSSAVFFSSLLILFHLLFSMFLENKIKISALIYNTSLFLFVGWLITGIYIFLNHRYYSVSVFSDSISYILIPNKMNFFVSMAVPELLPQFSYWWEVSIYLGIPVLIFAFAGLIVFREDKRIKYFAGLFLVFFSAFFLFSMKGIFLNLYFRTLPNLEFFNYPNRLRLLSNFALIMMACFAVDSFSCPLGEQNKKVFKRFILCIMTLLVLIIAFVLPNYYVETIVNSNNVTVSKLSSVCWFALLLFLNVITISLRVFKGSKQLLVVIIFLLVVDIFTFWSKMDPVSYKYGYGWDMKSPSAYSERGEQ